MGHISALAAGSPAVVLVKPQFEVGRARVGKGGVVREESLRHEAVEGVAAAADDAGLEVVGRCTSPVPGADGNVEFFLLLVRPSV
jgi:23S rRNA (cytidine1920-2'-O)/16S rRNA (cytidine1409-2'-O)-methyltransferase